MSEAPRSATLPGSGTGDGSWSAKPSGSETPSETVGESMKGPPFRLRPMTNWKSSVMS
jgi:hypothetical protein